MLFAFNKKLHVLLNFQTSHNCSYLYLYLCKVSRTCEISSVDGHVP